MRDSDWTVPDWVRSIAACSDPAIGNEERLLTVSATLSRLRLSRRTFVECEGLVQDVHLRFLALSGKRPSS